MAEPTPAASAAATPPSASSAPSPSTPAATTSANAAKPKPPQNPALKMMGLPALPRKLPSRNWLIFWAVSGSLTAAIVYDRREKRRATARWAQTVSHLAKEPLPGGNPSTLPRKLTIYLAAPPGDGLRIAQDHFREYIKPVLAASGLDWDFRQGRQQGDIRAVVAEEIRKRRRRVEQQDADPDAAEELPTSEDTLEAFRKQHGIPEYEGVRGDLVIGRNTWKEYIRGLHEGWLGPLKRPPHALPDPPPEPKEGAEGEEESSATPPRPAQPKPYNTVDDYETAQLPASIPDELEPSVPLPFPHVLGFSSTPRRLYRFLTRRYLADEIGREVAAACLCTYREYREVGASPAEGSSSAMGRDQQWEQQVALIEAEKDWVKSVWKVDDDEDKDAKKKTKAESADDASPTAADSEALLGAAKVKKEKIWPNPVVLDPRIGMRMRRFELLPLDEQRAAAAVVPEEQIEGWIKGSLRSTWRWAAKAWEGKKETIPNVGNVEE